MQLVRSANRPLNRGLSRSPVGGKNSGYATTPGSKSDQELNAQVISRRWYPRPKLAVGSTISVVNGLHCTNTTPVMQSGAITITAATRWIQTLVMSDADEYETETEATQLFSGGGSVVFTATTRAMNEDDHTFITDGGDYVVDGPDYIIDGA